jgi:phosphosulfolactate synthase (CoM biosynthesis protein A)
MENKQTAVEWLVSELNKRVDFIPWSKWVEINEIVQQAKEMEKEQHLEFWQGGIDCTQRGGTSFEQYYNETYGNHSDTI